MRLKSLCIAMVIEDEPGVRGVLSAMLSDLGCAVLASEDGTDLRDRLAALPPDIIFLDISLRGSTAYDVLEMLARCRFEGAVQIVSGQAPETIEAVHSSGTAKGLRMLPPLSKPFRLAAVETILDAWEAFADADRHDQPRVAPRSGNAIVLVGEHDAPAPESGGLPLKETGRLFLPTLRFKSDDAPQTGRQGWMKVALSEALSICRVTH